MLKNLKWLGLSVIAVFGMFVVSSLFSSQASASGFENEEVEEIIADFDLTKNEVQEQTFINENGEEVTVGIEPVIEDPSDRISTFASSSHSIKMGKSSFKAYWYTAAINMSYYIDINRTSTSTKITNARNLNVIGIGYSIAQNNWSHTTKTAKYEGTATMYGGYFSLNVYLISTVSGGTLTIKAKA